MFGYIDYVRPKVRDTLLEALGILEDNPNHDPANGQFTDGGGGGGASSSASGDRFKSYSVSQQSRAGYGHWKMTDQELQAHGQKLYAKAKALGGNHPDAKPLIDEMDAIHAEMKMRAARGK